MHKDPGHVFDYIIGKKFIIKETLSLDYFLGGYFKRVKDPKTENVIMTWGSKKYSKGLMEYSITP